MPSEGAPDVKFELLQEKDKQNLVSLTTKVFFETDAQKKLIMNETYWNWQYSGSFSENKNIVAKVDGKIVGSYPNLVVPIKYNDSSLKVSMCQDLLIDPDYRRFGLFSRMGDMAEKVMRDSQIDIAYSFPNHRSIPGFLRKHKYSLCKEIPLWVKFTSLRSAIKQKGLPFSFLGKPVDGMVKALFKPKLSGADWQLAKLDESHKSIDSIWKGFKNSHRIMVPRTSAFVQWRFFERPDKPYEVYMVVNADQPVGYFVTRTYRFFGIDVNLLMDFAFDETVSGAMDAMLHFVEQETEKKELGVVLFVLLGNSKIYSNLYKRLYLPIPSKVNPRKFNLVTKANTEAVDSTVINDPTSWFVNLADWDVL